MHTNAHRPSAPPPTPSCRPPYSLLLRMTLQILLDIGRRCSVPKSLRECLQSPHMRNRARSVPFTTAMRAYSYGYVEAEAWPTVEPRGERRARREGLLRRNRDWSTAALRRARIQYPQPFFDDDDDDDDDDVYYPKGRRPREDEEGEESYEKQRQRPGRGG